MKPAERKRIEAGCPARSRASGTGIGPSATSAAPLTQLVFLASYGASNRRVLEAIGELPALGDAAAAKAYEARLAR